MLSNSLASAYSLYLSIFVKYSCSQGLTTPREMDLCTTPRFVCSGMKYWQGLPY